jgi:hypothetical protein
VQSVGIFETWVSWNCAQLRYRCNACTLHRVMLCRQSACRRGCPLRGWRFRGAVCERQRAEHAQSPLQPRAGHGLAARADDCQRVFGGVRTMRYVAQDDVDAAPGARIAHRAILNFFDGYSAQAGRWAAQRAGSGDGQGGPVTRGESSVGFVDSRVCARAAPGPSCDLEDGRGVKPGWVSFCLVDEVGAVSGAPLRVRLVQAPAISGTLPCRVRLRRCWRFYACSAPIRPPTAGRQQTGA